MVTKVTKEDIIIDEKLKRLLDTIGFKPVSVDSLNYHSDKIFLQYKYYCFIIEIIKSKYVYSFYQDSIKCLCDTKNINTSIFYLKREFNIELRKHKINKLLNDRACYR